MIVPSHIAVLRDLQTSLCKVQFGATERGAPMICDQERQAFGSWGPSRAGGGTGEVGSAPFTMRTQHPLMSAQELK